jgi:hypothetical protein
VADTIDIRIKSILDSKGFQAAKQAIDALKKAQGGSSGANPLAQATKAQADALKLQAQAAKTAAAESNAATAAARAQAAQATAAAAAIRQQAQATAQAASAASQADRAILGNANAAAALARAQGDATGAANIYRAALTQLTPGSNQAVAAQTKLVQAMNAVNKSAREASGGASVLPRTIAGLSGEAQQAVDKLKGVAAGISGVVAVGATLKGAYDLAKLGAGAEAARQSFDKLAQSAGTSGKALLAGLQQAAQGTVAQTEIIKSANTALLLLGSDVATKLPQLLQVAKASATTLGQDVGFIFDSLVTGIARGSTELIDNAGITISATEAYATYAASIGKTADELTKAERSQAVLNGVLSAGQTIIAQTGDSSANAATQFQQFEAASKDLGVSLGALLAASGVPGFLAEVAKGAADGANELATIAPRVEAIGASITATSGSFADYSAQVTQVNNQLAQIGTSIQPLTEAQYNYAQSLVQTGMSAQTAYTQAVALAPVFQDIAVAQIDASNASAATGAAFAALGPQMASVAASGEYGRAAVQNLTYAFQDGALTVPQLQAALDALAITIANASVATDMHSAATAQYIGFSAGAAEAASGEAAATEESTNATLNDIAAKEAAAIQTQLLGDANAELMAAAHAAASGQGTASAAAAALASQFNIEYAAALKLINALRQLAGFQNTGVGSGRTVAAAAGRIGRDEVIAEQIQATRGLTAAEIQTQREANAAVTAANAAADKLREDTKKATQQAAKAARGGGGGGGGKGAGGGGGASAAREQAKVAEKAGDQLAKIQQQTGDKLADIDERAQQRLIAIDEKAAQQRVKAMQALDAEIASSSAATNADMLADNIDLYKDITDEQRASLQRREAAQAQYQQRVAQAQNEARQIAANGDAQYAREYLAAKTKEAQDLMQLEQQAAEARAETNDPAGLEQAVAQAVAARQAQTQTEIDLAQSAADQRAAAVEQEKADVIAESEAQKQKVIADATESAQAVKGASADATAAVIAGFKSQADAIKQATSAAKEYASAVSSASSSAPSSSGGSGASSGGSAPAPSGGSAGGGGGAATNGRAANGIGISGTPGAGKKPLPMANAGGLSGLDPTELEQSLKDLETINKLIDQYARRSKVDPGPAKKYADTVGIVRDALSATVELRQLMKSTGQPLDMAIITGLIGEITGIGKLFVQMNLGGKLNIGLLRSYGEGLGAALDVIKNVAEMRRDLQDLPPPIDLNIVLSLAAESRQVIRIVQGELIKLYQEEREALAQVGETMGDVTDILTSVIDLRNAVKDVGPPLLQTAVQSLADEAMATLQTMRSLQGLSASEGQALEDVATQVQHSVDILTAITDLRSAVQTVAPPISASLIQGLLDEGIKVRDAVAQMLPTATQATAGLESYANTVEQVAGALTNVVDLRKSLADIGPPIDLKAVEQLSAELRRVVMRFYTDAIPMAQNLITASEQYSTVAEQATSSLQGMADLREAVSQPLPPISDQAVERLSAELRKIVIRFFTDAIPLTVQISEAALRYGEVAQSAIETIRSAATLGTDLKDAAPIPLDVVQRLAADVYAVVQLFNATIMPLTESTADAVDRYASVAGNAIGTLSDAATLGADLKESSAIPLDKAQMLANDVRAVVQLFLTTIVPLTEETADAAGRYSDTVSSAVSVLSDVAGLGENIKNRYPINFAEVRKLANDARGIAVLFLQALLPFTQETADAAGRYADTVGSAVSVLSDVAGLGESLKTASPIPEAKVKQAIADAKRITRLVLDDLLPITQEEADAAGRYSDAAGSATSAISSVLGLTRDLFADYTSPTDAQINRIITDGDRIINAVSLAAERYSTDGLAAAQAYGDALGSITDALMSTGQLVEALKYGNDYAIDASVLTQFEGSAKQIIELGGRLGAVAAQQDYSALSGASAALGGLYDTLLKGASVPWGDLPTIAGGMSNLAPSSGGGMGGPLTVIQNIYAQPGQSPQAIASASFAQFNQAVSSRRTS